MTKLFIIVSIITLFIVYICLKSFNSDNKKIKGICYFDIDDTLTTSIENNEDLYLMH